MDLYFDTPVSTTTNGNTGTPSDDLRKGLIKTIFLTPSPAVDIQDADVADLEAALAADIRAVVASRLYPIQNVIGVEFQTVEAVYSTSGYGIEGKQKDAIPAFRFEIDCGEGLARALQKFDNRTMYVMFGTEDSYIWGTQKTGGGLRGVKMKVYVEIPNFKDGTNDNPVYIVLKTLNSSETRNSKAVYCNFAISSLEGLLDIELVEASTSSGAVIDVIVRENISKVNIMSIYETELETEANWVVVNSDTGASVTVTDATYNSTKDAMELTLDLAVDTNVTISLADVATLHAAGIEGYESLSVDVAVDIP